MIDFMLFGGFDNRRTDICSCRVAFATEKTLKKLKVLWEKTNYLDASCLLLLEYANRVF